MAKVAVVIRHLPNCRPITSAVIRECVDTDVDDMKHYLTSAAESHINRLKEDFVEFNDAVFYIDIIETSNR